MFAMDPRDPSSLTNLAKMVLEMDEKNHSLAVQMATSIREAILTLVTAMSLVTYCQDPENPILAITEEEGMGGDTVGHMPDELLIALTSSFPEVEEDFMKLVEKFSREVDERKADKMIAKLPKEITLDHILGEKED